MRTTVYIIFVIVLFAWGQVEAQTVPPTQTPLLTSAELFRYLISGLLGVLIWIARNTDSRIRKLETDAAKLRADETDSIARLTHTEKQITAMEHEQKNTLSIVMMQRETLLTKYHDKEDTEKHRLKVEETLEEQHKALIKQGETLVNICYRLDHFVRPSHRSADDERKYQPLDKQS